MGALCILSLGILRPIVARINANSRNTDPLNEFLYTQANRLTDKRGTANKLAPSFLDGRQPKIRPKITMATKTCPITAKITISFATEASPFRISAGVGILDLLYQNEI
jgi:hypothetical protein